MVAGWVDAGPEAGADAPLRLRLRDIVEGIIVARVLETADQTGPYADAEIYGRGLLDLGAATSPVGETAVALGDRVEGPATCLHTTSLHLGPAFGDGLATSFANREITAFDAPGAPFWYDLGAFVPAADVPSLAERLRDFQQLPAFLPSGSPANAITLAGTSSQLRTDHLYIPIS